MRSPITGSTHVLLEEKIPVNNIIEGYKSVFSIDVTQYFGDLKEVEIYKCLDTGYRYYYPFSLSGNGSFYDQLQKLQWYYQDWKWEYDAVFSLIQTNKRILEIGCGKGAFLNKIKSKAEVCIGLELSTDAVSSGIEQGLDIRQQTVEDFARNNPESFDMVCSFQLLEHITDVDSLLKSSLKALKKGGKLIIAVPNNDILLFKYTKKEIGNLNHLYQPVKLLNLPPHHMGLWNSESLESLSTIYNLKLESLLKEPLNDYRKDLTTSLLIDQLGFLGKPINRLPKAWQKWILKRLFPQHFYYADTIIAVLIKQ